MLHGALHRSLQADEISGEQEFGDLPTAVAQGLVAERPALEQGEEMLGGLTLVQHGRTRPHAQFAGLEALNELDLVVAQRAKHLTFAQRAAGARHLVGKGRCQRHWGLLTRSRGMSKLKDNGLEGALKWAQARLPRASQCGQGSPRKRPST